MILAIIQRYKKDEKEKFFSEIFYCDKYFKDIFEQLNVLLFPVAALTQIEEIVNICDGLLVTGRDRDVDPKYYGEEPIKETNLSNGYDKEDELDFTLIKAFHKVNKPILGICAGIQSINVCFGGSLYQNILNHSSKDTEKKHIIRIEKPSFLYECYKSKEIEVNSFHHQAIKKVADNFKVIATSSDEIIEAIEYKNILGVQWHPEKMNDLQFFKKYIELYNKI